MYVFVLMCVMCIICIHMYVYPQQVLAAYICAVDRTPTTHWNNRCTYCTLCNGSYIRGQLMRVLPCDAHSAHQSCLVERVKQQGKEGMSLVKQQGKEGMSLVTQQGREGMSLFAGQPHDGVRFCNKCVCV